MPPRSHGVIFISPITISIWICMRVPNLIPIGPQAATCIRPEGYTHRHTHTLLYRYRCMQWTDAAEGGCGGGLDFALMHAIRSVGQCDINIPSLSPRQSCSKVVTNDYRHRCGLWSLVWLTEHEERDKTEVGKGMRKKITIICADKL